MPKEIVNDRYLMPNQLTGEGPQPDTIPFVRVGWNRDAGDVQIATTAPDGVSLQPTPEGNGWFVNLDRDGINRLIRALRKARDAAYGSDA